MKSDTSLEAKQVQLEILRKMGPEKRLQASIDLTKISIELMKSGISVRHPNYTSEQKRLALIQLILPEDLFKATYPQAEDLLD